MTPQPGSWAIARHRLRLDTAAVVVLWIPFTLVVAAIYVLVGLYGNLSTSVWEQATQAPRWFAGGLGVYLTAVYLPLYITHGQTRRQFATQMPAFVVVLAALLAALITIGFAVERVVYDLGGWLQALERAHLFDGVDQYPVVLLEFWLVFMVWIAAGALVGAAFYRRPGLGLLLVPVVLAIVAAAELAVGTAFFGPFPEPLLTAAGVGLEARPIPVAVITCFTLAVVTAGLTWLVIRDLPIRSQAA